MTILSTILIVCTNIIMYGYKYEAKPTIEITLNQIRLKKWIEKTECKNNNSVYYILKEIKNQKSFKNTKERLISYIAYEILWNIKRNLLSVKASSSTEGKNLVNFDLEHKFSKSNTNVSENETEITTNRYERKSKETASKISIKQLHVSYKHFEQSKPSEDIELTLLQEDSVENNTVSKLSTATEDNLVTTYSYLFQPISNNNISDDNLDVILKKQKDYDDYLTSAKFRTTAYQRNDKFSLKQPFIYEDIRVRVPKTNKSSSRNDPSHLRQKRALPDRIYIREMNGSEPAFRDICRAYWSSIKEHVKEEFWAIMEQIKPDGFRFPDNYGIDYKYYEKNLPIGRERWGQICMEYILTYWRSKEDDFWETFKRERPRWCNEIMAVRELLWKYLGRWKDRLEEYYEHVSDTMDGVTSGTVYFPISIKNPFKKIPKNGTSTTIKSKVTVSKGNETSTMKVVNTTATSQENESSATIETDEDTTNLQNENSTRKEFNTATTSQEDETTASIEMNDMTTSIETNDVTTSIETNDVTTSVATETSTTKVVNTMTTNVKIKTNTTKTINIKTSNENELDTTEKFNTIAVLFHI